jgi:hypothetical protein
MSEIPMQKGKNGNIIKDIKDSEYRSASGLSNSMLKHFIRSPKHYLLATETVFEPTESMQFGSAIDAEILRKNPSDYYVVMPKVDGRTKEGKALKEKIQKEAEGKAVISEESAQKIPFIKESLYGHPEVGKILRGLTMKQFALFGTISTEHGDVALKGLVDGYDETTGTMFDLKTAQNASPSGFSKAIRDFGYAYQNIQYVWLAMNAGLKVNRFVFGVVDNDAPFVTGAYSIHEDVLKRAYENWLKSINKYAYCQKSGDWDGYGKEVITLSPYINE